MQRFLTIYTAVTLLFAAAGSVWATESADRYGRPYPPTDFLAKGNWWNASGILTPVETEGLIGEFVVVKGRVLDVFETRNDRYLNFG